MVGHSAAASELSGTAGSQALHELGDDVFGVGPTGAEEASQLVASAFGDGLAVDEDLELSFVTRLDGHVDIKAFFDDGGETRRAFLVASSGAVTDLDVHDASKGAGVSSAPHRTLCAPERKRGRHGGQPWRPDASPPA